jgi:hypothetical protein
MSKTFDVFISYNSPLKKAFIPGFYP